MHAGGPDIPAFARPLVDQLTAAGVIVRWNLGPHEWFELDALIKKSGVPALVDFARRQAAHRDVQYARYFLRGGWRELPPKPSPGTSRPPLRTVTRTGSRADTHTADDYLNSSVEDLFAS